MDGLSHERTLCAKSISLAAASDYFFVLVDFRKSENQKGISDSAESDSGLCPETVSYTHLDVYKRQALGIRSLGGVVRRDVGAAQTGIPRGQQHGQHTGHRAQLSLIHI